MPVPGCPITVGITGGTTGPQVSLGGPGPVHMSNSLVINHPGGRLDDVEVNVEGILLFFNIMFSFSDLLKNSYAFLQVFCFVGFLASAATSYINKYVRN